MAPERTECLVVLDLSFEGDVLKGSVEYFEAPPDERLRVRWAAESKPQGFFSVHGGIAYGLDTGNVITTPGSQDALPEPSDGGHKWEEGGLPPNKPCLMLILILPKNYTLTDSEPLPISAKIFEGRLALYWILKTDDNGRTKVEWRIKEVKGDLLSEVKRINKASVRILPSSLIKVEDEETKSRDLPTWFPVCGVLFAGITLFFLMALVVLSIFGMEIPPTSRFVLVACLALGSGLSVTFLGGTAVAQGAISLPFLEKVPCLLVLPEE